MKENLKYYDTVIIGGGPAGVSSALYIQRANLSSAIFYGENSSLMKAEKIENYYGFFSKNKFDNSGKSLFETGIAQAQSLGAETFNNQCFSIEYDFSEKRFICTFDNIKTKSKALIISTGSVRKKPKIENLDRLEGSGVSYCAVCDSFFYKEKDVCVVGNGNYAFEEASVLLNVAKTVTLCTNGEPLLTQSENYKHLLSNLKFKIIDKKIKSIDGKLNVESITLENHELIKCNGVFIALGVAGADSLAKKIGAITENGKIITDENMKTSIDGLFAAGDCTKGLLQVSKAVYDGTIAGLGAINHCKKTD
ncbi:MAG: FAD-dependent oxidoreductase [Oscillospiraceae bacterium]